MRPVNDPTFELISPENEPWRAVRSVILHLHDCTKPVIEAQENIFLVPHVARRNIIYKNIVLKLYRYYIECYKYVLHIVILHQLITNIWQIDIYKSVYVVRSMTKIVSLQWVTICHIGSFLYRQSRSGCRSTALHSRESKRIRCDQFSSKWKVGRNISQRHNTLPRNIALKMAFYLYWYENAQSLQVISNVNTRDDVRYEFYATGIIDTDFP